MSRSTLPCPSVAGLYFLAAATTVSSQPAAGGGDPGRLAAMRRHWAALLAVALAAVTMPVDLQAPHPLCVAQLRRAVLGQHLQEVSAAAARHGASKLAHYLATAWGAQLPPSEEYAPALAAHLARCGSARGVQH